MFFFFLNNLLKTFPSNIADLAPDAADACSNAATWASGGTSADGEMGWGKPDNSYHCTIITINYHYNVVIV